MKASKDNTRLATIVLSATLFLLLSLTARAQFSFSTNNGAITLTGYSGPGGAVTIPGFVTAIGDSVFWSLGSLTSITIPATVTTIGNSAFAWCVNLTNLTIPANVTSIGQGAFSACTSLTNVTIPASVNFLGQWAFFYCPNLQGLYFRGNAPAVGGDVFSDGFSYTNNITTVYYYSGYTGWSNTFGGRPTQELPPFQVRSTRPMDTTSR